MGNEVVSEALQQVSLYDTVMWVLFIGAAISVISIVAIRIYKFMDKYREIRNQHDDFKALVNEHTNDIKDLKAGQSDMYATMQEISANVQIVTDKIDEMQRQKNEQDRASIKEKLLRLYYHCHETMSMTQIEKDTIESLIASYESAGGRNSYIHTLLIPEMYKWTLIK